MHTGVVAEPPDSRCRLDFARLQSHVPIENKKKPVSKNIIMLFLSLALGGAGVYFSKQLIEDRISFYRTQMEVKDELVEVVVPKRKLLRGEVVTAENISLRQFPKVL